MRKSNKMIGATMALAVATMACLRAQGASAPELPPNAVAADTVAVVHMDATHFNPEALRSAAKAVLGPNAERANDQLAKFEEKFKKAQAAGVDSMTLVMSAKDKDKAAASDGPGPGPDQSGIGYMHVKSGSDPKAVVKLLEDEMDPTAREKQEITTQGQYVVTHPVGQKLPTAGDAARSKQFADALGTIGTSAIQVAFIPDAKTKQEMLNGAAEEPQALKNAMPMLANSKYMTMAISLGNAPSLTATANAADEASAKKLLDSVNEGVAEMKKMAADAQAGNGAGGPLAMLAPVLGTIAQGLTPTQTGNDVSVSLKGQSLNMIANMGMMFAGGGAGGPGAGPGPAGRPPRRVPGAGTPSQRPAPGE